MAVSPKCGHAMHNSYRLSYYDLITVVSSAMSQSVFITG